MDDIQREGFLDLNLPAWRFRYPDMLDSAAFLSIKENIPSFSVPIERLSLPPFKNARVIVVFDCKVLLDLYPAVAGKEQTGILLIQSNPALILHAFQQSDYRELILSPFVFWIAGENWKQHLRILLEERFFFLLSPDTFHFINPSGDIPMETATRQFFQQQIPAAKTDYNKRQSLYLSSSPLKQHSPLRVWAHTESKSPVYAGLIHAWTKAFRHLGAEVFLSDFTCSWRMREKITSELVRFSPHLIFLLNGPSPAILQYLGLSREWAAGIPSKRVTWYVDNPPYLSTYSSAVDLYRKDSIAVMDESYFEFFNGMQPESLFHLLPASMIEHKGVQRDEYRFPIVYVGNIINLLECFNSLSLDAKDLVMELLRLKKQSPRISFTALIHNFQPEPRIISEVSVLAAKILQDKMGKKLLTAELTIDYFLYVMATFFTRWEIVKSLLPLGLHIFGPNDWLPLLGDSYRDRHHGPIGFTDLPDCYASAEINLNFHSLQCPTALNPRDFDVLASGGFLITDWVADLEKGYLQNQKHLSVAENPDDFTLKAEYYLDHKKESRDLAESGCDWVYRHHTYLHRARVLLQNVFPMDYS